MLPGSKAVCWMVVSLGQGDEGIECIEPAFIDRRATETRLNLPMVCHLTCRSLWVADANESRNLGK